MRANAVEVLKLFRAYCKVENCLWIGNECGTYQEANSERQAHLDWHRAAESGA